MPDKSNKISQFWQEFRRRKVLPFLIGYIAACFAIIEFLSNASERYSIPDTTIDLLYILAAVGLPIVIVLPWFINRKKPEGITDDLGEMQFNAKLDKSIIVLPFENISPDPDQEYFSDGLTEEIITDLSHIHDLMVISRSSSMTFKGLKITTREIADKVNVRYVLEGSVRKEGSNLRIVAQLIDAKTDAHIWAEKYNGLLDDVFDIQEKVSRSIVEALKVELTSQEDEQISERPINDVQIYECYLKAKHEISHTAEEAFIRAQHILEKGIELYGENATLYATLGYVKYFIYDSGIVMDNSILDEVENLANKSLSIMPDLAQGHLLLALLERGRGNLMNGYQFIKKAYSIDPDDSTILMYMALFLGNYAGRSSEANLLFERLIKNDPLSPLNYLFNGCNCQLNGQYKKAKELFEKTAIIDPDFPWGKYLSAIFHAARYRNDESVALLEQVSGLKHLPQIHVNILHFLKFAVTGESYEAKLAYTDDVKRYITNDPDFMFLMPGFLVLMEQKDEAYLMLEHAVNRGYINYPYFNEFDPLLGKIRNEPRFIKLMKRVKHEWENFDSENPQPYN